MKKGLIDVISLGCSKNLVDSERLIRRLEAKGYEMRADSECPEGEWVVLNTCGFIGDAKQESIDTLLQLTSIKEQGLIGHIAVMGCLSQRYLDDLRTELPEVDRWYGKFDWTSFCEDLPDLTSDPERLRPWERRLTTPPYSAYLKISEGCDRFCAFCAIPLITGRHTSRPVEEILEEARQLASEGVVELNVIAQDLSAYGRDLPGGRSRLAELVDRLADVEGIKWIRLHYAYPADFPYDVLEVMRRRENVCSYLDIALQHISDEVLANMRRHVGRKETIELLERLRREVPGIKIRTTMMVGFPGEGEKEFEELMEFVREARFDRMGAFAYCEEEDTYAARHLEDTIPQEIKQERLDKLMALQQDIALEVNEEMIGETVEVLIERIEEGKGVGRTEWDSPEVDPEVIVSGASPEDVGAFVKVKITAAYPYELEGEKIC